jgi:hypothetical protein
MSIPENNRLTIDELRVFPGYENISDEEGERIINEIERFSKIMLTIFNRSNNEEANDTT